LIHFYKRLENVKVFLEDKGIKKRLENLSEIIKSFHRDKKASPPAQRCSHHELSFKEQFK